MIVDTLIEAIIEKQNPACVGLDTAPAYVPDLPREKGAWAERVARFNENIIAAVADIVPAVKVQVAYYEALGVKGMECFKKTCACAKAHGLVVIADCKRNDIGATAAQYAKAFLGEEAPLPCDLLTVNGYLGTDGVAPFLEESVQNDRGIFVLVKTSNPSSGELQNLKLADGGGENFARAHAAFLLPHPGLRRAGRECRNAQKLFPRGRHGRHRE